MKENNSKIILVIVVGFTILSMIFEIKNLFYTGISIGTLSILSIRIESFIVFLWEKIAQVLGWINTKIILSLVFFVFLIPFAFLAKIFSKNSLKLKNNEESTFVDRSHVYTKKDLENIW